MCYHSSEEERNQLISVHPSWAEELGLVNYVDQEEAAKQGAQEQEEQLAAKHSRLDGEGEEVVSDEVVKQRSRALQAARRSRRGLKQSADSNKKKEMVIPPEVESFPVLTVIVRPIDGQCEYFCNGDQKRASLVEIPYARRRASRIVGADA